MFVVGVVMPSVRMNIVVAENGPVPIAFDTGVIVVLLSPYVQLALPILNREFFEHLKKQPVLTPNLTFKNQKSRRLPQEGGHDIMLDDESLIDELLHVAIVDVQVRVERVPVVRIAPITPGRHA
jgi:hypothetical protein